MGHSQGPVVLGLLPTGKGNGFTTPWLLLPSGAALWAGSWAPSWKAESHFLPSFFCKVWAAWLGFVLEKRRKKARLEQAMQAYHQQLLQEGATRLLRFTAGMKALRQQLQAQQQVQVSQSCW